MNQIIHVSYNYRPKELMIKYTRHATHTLGIELRGGFAGQTWQWTMFLISDRQTLFRKRIVHFLVQTYSVYCDIVIKEFVVSVSD
jgi:hypothetical protein